MYLSIPNIATKYDVPRGRCFRNGPFAKRGGWEGEVSVALVLGVAESMEVHAPLPYTVYCTDLIPRFEAWIGMRVLAFFWFGGLCALSPCRPQRDGNQVEEVKVGCLV
jgi:hypothetical protein